MRWDLLVGILPLPTSGQLSASATKGSECGDRGRSFRDEGVVPALDPDADVDEAPLRLDEEVDWVDCALAEITTSGCREPEGAPDGSRGGDGARGTWDGAACGRD